MDKTSCCGAAITKSCDEGGALLICSKCGREIGPYKNKDEEEHETKETDNGA